MRCFISINLPKEIEEEIGKIQEKLPDFYGKITFNLYNGKCKNLNIEQSVLYNDNLNERDKKCTK